MRLTNHRSHYHPRFCALLILNTRGLNYYKKSMRSSLVIVTTWGGHQRCFLTGM